MHEEQSFTLWDVEECAFFKPLKGYSLSALGFGTQGILKDCVAWAESPLAAGLKADFEAEWPDPLISHPWCFGAVMEMDVPQHLRS